MTAKTIESDTTAARPVEHAVKPAVAIGPALVAVAAAVGAHSYALYPMPANAQDAIAIGGALASIGGTMLGFMLAALAVLASINHLHLVRMMKRTGHYADLLSTLFAGGLAFLACCLSGFALLFGATPTAFGMALVVGVHVGALWSLLDIGRKFWFVLSNLQAD